MRLNVEAAEEVLIACSVQSAWDLVRNVPAALALLPFLDAVEPRDDAGDEYLFWLGPFGVGSLQGRLRCDVIATRCEGAEPRLTLRSRGPDDLGNTDCIVDLRLREATGGVAATAFIRASPRREIPSVLMPLVRRVATRTVRAGLADGLDRARRELT